MPGGTAGHARLTSARHSSPCGRSWAKRLGEGSFPPAASDRLRSLLEAAVGDELLRGRVAALASSIEELLRELDDVDDRLAELQVAVRAELDVGA